MLTDPNLIQRGLTGCLERNYKLPPLITVFLGGLENEKSKKTIDENDLMIPLFNVPYDMKMQNPLIMCFTHEVTQITTAELLIKHILNFEKSYHHQCILMSIMPLILSGDFELTSLEQFFIDVNGASHDEYCPTNTIGWKICDLNLKAYSSKQMLYNHKYLHYAENVEAMTSDII